MKRVIVLLACGSALSACTSMNLSMPSMDFGGALKGSPATVNVRVESQPQGAEARGSGGGACRTPCTLAVPANGTSTVSFTLQNYLPTQVPVTVRTVRETWDNAESGAVGEQVTIDPNPVFAILDPAPPPPPPKRAPAKPKPRAQAPKPQQQQQQPAPAFGPAPPPPGFR
jgi:hypothetical protein